MKESDGDSLWRITLNIKAPGMPFEYQTFLYLEQSLIDSKDFEHTGMLLHSILKDILKKSTE